MPQASSAEITASEISRNKQGGVTAALSGTTVSISGSKVVRNQGHGLTLLKGAEAVVSATTLSGNGGMGADACVHA
jgi:hypothetical protein